MNIISIDPSKSCTGYYLKIDGVEESGCIKNKPGTPNNKALNYIYESVTNLVIGEDIKMAFIESASPNPKNPINSMILLKVAGVIELAMEKNHIEVITIPPKAWKAHTIGQISKTNKKAYLKAVVDTHGKEFSTTDEADAYMIYRAMIKIAKKTAYLKSYEVKIKEKIKSVMGDSK